MWDAFFWGMVSTSSLLVGGLIGAAIGVQIFNALKAMGQVDLLVRLSYVVFLGIIGALMFVESLNAIRKTRSGKAGPTRKKHTWVHNLPFKMKFRTSGLYISVIPPLAVGALVGFLAAIMGVGGGFVVVPAMIYILGMPTKVVVGASTGGMEGREGEVMRKMLVYTGILVLMMSVLAFLAVLLF